MAFFFTSYVNLDGAAGLVVEVLKPQAFVLRTDHLICLSIMREEFGTIDASSFCFRPSQATLTEAPEKFNASLMHGDHALMVSEISIRNHLSRILTVLFLKTIHRKRQFFGILGSLTDSYPHNQSLSCISRELEVIARRNRSISLTHKASVRIGYGNVGRFGFAVFFGLLEGAQ